MTCGAAHLIQMYTTHCIHSYTRQCATAHIFSRYRSVGILRRSLCYIHTIRQTRRALKSWCCVSLV